jgi:nitrate/nitrite transporter NarK
MATVGNLGGYVAPITLGLVKQSTGRLEDGLYTLAAAMIIGSVLMMLLTKLRSAAPASYKRPDVSGSLVGGEQ